MADATISGSDPRKLYDHTDPPPVTTGGPPPKKSQSTTTGAEPQYSGPSAYDVKDVAKYMAVTKPAEPTLESLKAQKSALDAKLAAPVDYSGRKLDEARRDDLARRILDRESEAKAIAKDAQCPAWAACQPVPKGYDPNAGGWSITTSQDQGTFQATAAGSDDGRVRVGFVDATTVDGKPAKRVDQVGVGVLKLQNQSTSSDGATRSTTVTAGAVSAQTGPTNADGSKGLGFDVSATAVGIERNYSAPDGTSFTVGVSAGASAGASVGVKDAPNGGKAVCSRAELGPVTLGGCAPVTEVGSES